MTATILEATFPYEYTDTDGTSIRFREGERFILLAKSSDDWWKVKRTGLFDGKSDIYVPVTYVREVNTKPVAAEIVFLNMNGEAEI